MTRSPAGAGPARRRRGARRRGAAARVRRRRGRGAAAGAGGGAGGCGGRRAAAARDGTRRSRRRAFVDDGRQRCADLEHVVAHGHEQLADHAVVEDLDLDVGFVGLDHRDQVAAVHRVARLHEPFEQPPLGHVGAERRHAEHARFSHRSPASPPRRPPRPKGARHPRDASRTASAPRRCTPARPARRGRRTPARTIRAAISAEMDPLRQPSSTITARCVRRTDSMIVSSSSGRSVRRSITSASMPPSASSAAAASATAQRAAVGDQRDVVARARRIAARVMSTGPASSGSSADVVVERRVLEEQHGVGVGERGPQHAARVVHRRGSEDPQAGNVRVPALEAVRVLRGDLATAAGRHADHERHVALPARHVEVAWRRC